MISVIAALSIVLAQCSSHETSRPTATASEGGSSPPFAETTSTTTDGAVATVHTLGASTTGRPSTEITVPGIGVLSIRRTSAEGIVIRDERTGGRRFFLTDIGAGECLDFLRANPQPSQEAFSAACPGEQH